jgi:undecaprenyl-diphosphatase
MDGVTALAYALIAALLLAEAVGLPLPGEATLAAGAALAARGQLSLVAVVAVAASAAVAGDAIGYALGRRDARWLPACPSRLRGDREGALVRAARLFARRGPWAVPLARWRPALRPAAPWVAGAGAVRWRAFAPRSAIGAAPWAAAIATAAFLLVRAAVRMGGPVLGDDRQVATWIHHHRVDELDVLWRGLAIAGGGAVLGGVVALIALALVSRGRRRLALFFGAVFCGAELLTWALKQAIGRARPPAFEQVVHLTTPSFPSGHALGAAALATAGLLVLRRTPPSRWRVLGVWACATFALVVGLSRLALDVHYVTDVLAGWALGGAWALAWAMILRLAPPARRLARAPA